MKIDWDLFWTMTYIVVWPVVCMAVGFVIGMELAKS